MQISQPETVFKSQKNEAYFQEFLKHLFLFILFSLSPNSQLSQQRQQNFSVS